MPPIRRDESDSETEVTASEDVSEVEEENIDGSLRTQLVWNVHEKQLSVHMKQLVSTKMRMEMKWKGFLNTANGGHHMTGQLVKSFQTNTLSLQNVYNASRLHTLRQRLVAAGPGDPRSKEALQQISSKLRELRVDPDAFVPGGWKPLLLTDWVFQPGMTYDSERQGSGGIRPALIIKKAPQLIIHSPRTDLMVSGKATTEFDSSNNKITSKAGIRLKLYKFNVTSKQDLTVTMGMDVATQPLDASKASQGKTWYQAPYLKISEKNTSLRLEGGRWTFTYTM